MPTPDVEEERDDARSSGVLTRTERSVANLRALIRALIRALSGSTAVEGVDGGRVWVCPGFGIRITVEP